MKKSNILYIIFISFSAAVGGFLFGYDLSLISGAQIYLFDYLNINDSSYYQGLVTSAAIFGCIAGPLLGIPVADKIGRKYSMIIASLLLILSAIGSAISTGIWEFAIYRWVGGVGVGLASVISPLYIAEISPAKMRGKLVTLNQLAIVIGLNIAGVMAFVLGDDWRWMFGSEAFPIILFVFAIFFLPNSPRWLATKGRKKEALDTLTRINGETNAKTEMYEINEELNKESGSFRELFEPGIRVALLIAIVVMVYQQLTGATAFITYVPVLMKEAGVASNSDAVLDLVFVNLPSLIITFVAIWAIGKYSRKNLFINGIIGIIALLIFMIVIEEFNLSSNFMLAALILIVAVFNLTLGPLAWLVVSEIFPNKIRNKAMSIAVTCLWIGGFNMIFIFPVVKNWAMVNFGNKTPLYLMFIVINILGLIFIWKKLPEMKDMSLEKISKYWLDYGKDNNR